MADAFTQAIDSSVKTLVEAPTRWRVIKKPEIRRFVLKRFPFVIYYRWEPLSQRVAIYAIMHTSRKPGYWRHRLEPGPKEKQ